VRKRGGINSLHLRLSALKTNPYPVNQVVFIGKLITILFALPNRAIINTKSFDGFAPTQEHQNSSNFMEVYMSDENRYIAVATTILPLKLNRAHRFALALQRLLALQEYNPLGGDHDG
jgi:hypothetical protein